MRHISLAARSAATLMAVSLSAASIEFRTFAEIASEADRIVFGEVTSVESFPGGKRLAKIHVLESWRGPQARELIIDVSSTFACDESTALPGERAVFLLASSADSDNLRLAYFGRGRLPVKVIEGDLYVERVWSSDLPEWMAFRVGTPPRFNDKGRVYAFADVKRYLVGQ